MELFGDRKADANETYLDVEMKVRKKNPKYFLSLVLNFCIKELYTILSMLTVLCNYRVIVTFIFQAVEFTSLPLTLARSKSRFVQFNTNLIELEFELSLTCFFGPCFQS